MLDIRLFGETIVTTPQGAVTSGSLGGAKPRQILEILALAAGTPVPKEYLADLLWDGHPPRSYLATLESYVCVLRKSLGLARGRDSALATTMRGYVLDPGAVRVDLTSFRADVRAARAAATPAAALERIEQALGRVTGELLAGDTYATWAAREREQFRPELVAAATYGATLALELGQHDAAVRMAGTAVGQDALAEAAWRLLMRALCAAGRTSEALRAYGELRDHVGTELGTEPSQESVDLYLQILRGDQGARTTTTTAQLPDGREEVRALMNLLRQAVASIPGMEEPRGYRALARVAADLVA